LFAAVAALVFFVVSMIVIPSSQLAIAQKYALHDDGNSNNDHQNDMGSTASTKTTMMMMSSTAPTIASKTNSISPDLSLNSMPVGENCAKNMDGRPNPLEYLTYFNCGHVTQYKNGTLLRHFSLVITENKDIPISDIDTNDPVIFHAWTFNDTIPGPTMRMTEGDHVQITVYNSKSSQHPHSLHMHSIHSGIMDGVYGSGGSIGPGQNYTYSFVASPYGVYPYHCHVESVQSHINHGLYGVMIIDPKTPRPPAKEMVMLMNGYNLVDDYKSNESGILRPPTAAELRTDFNKATHIGQAIGHPNQIYSVNGPAFIYRDHPIQLVTGQLYRIYLLNMLEFEPINSFHLHGNMFDYYPAGTGLSPSYKTDIVELGQGNRGIVEFTYDKPGMFMFHAHINGFTDLGWMGMLDVVKNKDMSKSLD
jgi:hypothetical protein